MSAYRNFSHKSDHNARNFLREIVDDPFLFIAKRVVLVNVGTVDHQVFERGPELLADRPQTGRLGQVPIVPGQLVDGPVPVGDRTSNR